MEELSVVQVFWCFFGLNRCAPCAKTVQRPGGKQRDGGNVQSTEEGKRSGPLKKEALRESAGNFLFGLNHVRKPREPPAETSGVLCRFSSN